MLTDRPMVVDSWQAWPTSLRVAADLVQHASFPSVLILCNKLQIAAFNEGFARLLGRDWKEAVGRCVADVLPRMAAVLDPQLTRAIAGETLLLEQVAFRLGTGSESSERIFDYGFAPVRDDKNVVVAVLGTAVEVTGRYQVERRLRDSEERLLLAQEVAGIGSWDFDPQLTIGHVSDSYRRIHGLHPAQQGDVTTADEIMNAVHPADRQRFLDAVRAGLRSPADTRLDYRVVHRDGAVRHVAGVGRADRDEMGKPVRIVGIVADVTDQRLAEERAELLNRELHHRVKNTLAIVQAIAAATARTASDVRQFNVAFSQRLQALSRAHDLLLAGHGKEVSLPDLLITELAPYTGGNAHVVHSQGPEVLLPASHALPLGMVLHELATNAAKHGALKHAGGEVQIHWDFNDGKGDAPEDRNNDDSDDGNQRLRIVWQETGAPSLQDHQASARQGFGSQLLERLIRGQLKANVVREFTPVGLRIELDMPLGRDRMPPPVSLP